MKISQFAQTTWTTHIQHLRECTRTGYMSAYTLHIHNQLGSHDLDTIDADTIETWLHTIPTAGAARKAYAVLRSIIRLAVRKGTTSNDPTRHEIRLPRLAHYDAPVLTAKEAQQLLQGFYGHPLEAWLICALCAGLRREEACGLEWKDLDLKRGTIHIRRAAQYLNGHEQIEQPKTEMSSRPVQLPNFATKRLAQLKRGKTGRITGTLNPQQVARQYQSHCKKNHLPYVPPKSLRHTWGTLAIKAGNDISVVARQLRHTDITTTAKYYLKPDMSILRDAQRNFEKLIVR